MKSQALISSKDKSEKLKCCLLQFLFGALRVTITFSPKRVGADLIFDMRILLQFLTCVVISYKAFLQNKAIF